MKSKKDKRRKGEGADGFGVLPWVSQETKNSIFAIILFLLAVLSALALLDYAGVAGSYGKSVLAYLFGSTALLVPICLALTGLALIVHLKRSHWLPVFGGGALVFVSIIGLVQLMQSSDSGAGVVGYGITYPVVAFLSTPAGVALFVGLLLVGMLILFDVSLLTIVGWFRRSREEGLEETGDILEASEWSSMPIDKLNRMRRAGLVFTGNKDEQAGEEKDESASKDSTYEPPPLTLLEQDGAGPSAGDIQANKHIIQRTLEEFGIEVEMADVSVGPTVTQYTLKPAQGVNVTRITALSKNLSLALAAHPIRIEAPIPGKPLVGVEVPNKQAAVVRLKSLLAGMNTKKLASSLVLPLGRDVAGESIIAFLDKMPHLLISGSTGSGKSICLNTIVLSLVFMNSPANLRFLLIDPKRVEFSNYEGIPHLIAPVVVDTKKAISALKWVITEMEHRYEVLEKVNVRDIKSYNELMKKKSEKPLPYLVVIIDEMADLMMKYKREVEASIVRIAQMARAVGIHLITATQRPSTNVVTGLIKANIIARVAFKMPTQIDSRTILDQGGAEKLLGYGDMLFMSGDSAGLKRIQGTFVSDKELKKVVEYLRNLDWEDEYAQIDGNKEEKNNILSSADFGNDFGSDDDLYEDAKVIAREAGKVSASLLQRKLQVGYARAARMLDMMEEEGIIGSAQGAKPREVIKE